MANVLARVLISADLCRMSQAVGSEKDKDADKDTNELHLLTY